MRAIGRLRRELLDRIPDDPVWIEARAALLDPGSRLSGDSRAYVIRSDRLRLAAISARASQRLVRGALSDIADAGADPTALWAVVAPEGFTAESRAGLAGWTTDEAHIYREPKAGGVSTRPTTADVGLMARRQAALLEDLPRALAAELIEAVARTDVAAVWIDGRPVSFCYVACESEAHWDISINTVAEFRRHGLAAECVGWLAAAMRKRGKRAVWGAHSGNVASQRLAEKLGFEPWGRLWLFENWDGEPEK